MSAKKLTIGQLRDQLEGLPADMAIGLLVPLNISEVTMFVDVNGEFRRVHTFREHVDVEMPTTDD